MIPKSIIYKAVRKSDHIVIAEGNKAEMKKLTKKNKTLSLMIGSTRSQLGEKLE